jgi:nitric oxide reductase subunit B
MIVGFSILTIVTVQTYDYAPPIAARFVDDAGRTLFTRDDVERGQEVFFKYGLMEHGTLWGHGAYLGPDYTAEYLHRLAEISRDVLAMARQGKAYAALDPELARGIDATIRAEAKKNHYDPATDTLRFSASKWRRSRPSSRSGATISAVKPPPPVCHRVT